MSAFQLKKHALEKDRSASALRVAGDKSVSTKTAEPKLVRVSFGNPHLWEVLKAIVGGGNRG